MANVLFHLEGAVLGYGRSVVLDDVSLCIEAGDFYGIVGPNGSGKTTLLKTFMGILKPISGRFERMERIRIGYVPQRETVDTMWPLTASDIALQGSCAHVRFGRLITATHRLQAIRALEHVGMADQKRTLYRNLSGGQKQRVLIARALAGEPSVLILDEPTNGMDLPSEQQILQLLERLHSKEGITIILVSHLLNTVATYARHLAVIEEGRLRAGELGELLQESVLKQVYGIDVEVAHIGKRTVVLAKENSDVIS